MLGPLYIRARDPLGFLVWEATAPTRPQLRAYPREDVLRRVLQPRETQVFSGNEVARRKGEGIEFADIRPWTPGDPLKRDQLARERAARRAVGEREPPRAQHRRDPLRRLVRGGAARTTRRRSTSPCARHRLSPMPTCAGATASGLSLRRDPALARPRHRARAALPDRRRAARHADHPLLLLEGDRRDPAPHAAAERARDRAVTAARPALRRRAARSARPRLRPRSDRRLAGPVRRSLRPAGLDAFGARHLDRCGATRCDTVCSARASRSSSGSEARPLQSIVEEVREFRRYARHARV